MDDTPYGRASQLAREQRSVHLQKQRAASLSLARPSTAPHARQPPQSIVQVLRATGGRKGAVSVTTVRDRLSGVPALLDTADVLLGSEIAKRFGGDFDLMLPPSMCPEAVRLAVRKLSLWVLARSDAGRLDADSLVEVMAAGSARSVAATGSATPAGAAVTAPAALQYPRQPAEETEAKSATAEREGLGDHLLSPAACGALAHLAFDAAAALGFAYRTCAGKRERPG